MRVTSNLGKKLLKAPTRIILKISLTRDNLGLKTSSTLTTTEVWGELEEWDRRKEETTLMEDSEEQKVTTMPMEAIMKRKGTI